MIEYFVDGILFQPSNRMLKKYLAIFPDGKKVHFGDIRYQHYKDKIGYYSNLDHRDWNRRKQYLARHKKLKDKTGDYAYRDKQSPAYLSIKYLW